MIPEIKKILYATDLSVNSMYAFRYAINFAKKYDAGITILHVIKEVPLAYDGLMGTYALASQPTLFEESKTVAMDRIRKRINVLSDEELKGDPDCIDRITSIEICSGYPAEVILRKADSFGCDVIIIGTHGKGILRHAFFGNTAKQIVRRVRKPVFIVPLPEGVTDKAYRDI